MTRSSSVPKLDLDIEIEKTLRAIKRSNKISEKNTIHTEEMEYLNNRTLKDLATPDVNYQPLCMNLPNIDAAFELKPGFVNLLPKFHGLAGEDPHKHLKEFYIICQTCKSPAISDDQVKAMAFPLTLHDLAKDWFYYLPVGAITTWQDMKRLFLEKYFPASKAAAIRKEICGIRQNHEEALYDYWERFKKLCASCPHHQITDQLLIQYFYEGLLPMDRSMIDAASGGALVDKTPEAARQLIANMAENSQQFGVRRDSATRRIHDSHVAVAADHKSLDSRLDELTSAIKQLTMQQAKQTPSAAARVCGICSLDTHPTDSCPTLQEDEVQPQAYAAGVFPNRPQPRYDPYSNSYNPGWRDHPNLRYGNAATPPSQQPFHQQNYPHTGSNNRPQQPLENENMLTTLLQNDNTLTNLLQKHDSLLQKIQQDQRQYQQDQRQYQQDQKQYQQKNDAAIHSLQTQLGQMASTINELQFQRSGQLPSQTIQNPRENVSAIILRGGKEVHPRTHDPLVAANLREGQQTEKESEPEFPSGRSEKQPENKKEAENGPEKENHPEELEEQRSPYPPPPFPQRLANNTKKEKEEEDIFDVFSKVEINIPLLEAIRQIPKYCKFLRDLCTQKRRSRSNEKRRIASSENVSAIIMHKEKKLPEKCNDPGTFLIPCTIGGIKFHAMLDLGASINVMPSSIYASLRLGTLKQTNVVIQLANSSHAYPRGVVEDVLVKVKNLVFPADFFILDMENNTSSPIILGRPFLKTARTKIDVSSGALTMEFDGEIADFDIADSVSSSALNSSLCVINAFDFIVAEDIKLQNSLESADELEAIPGLMELGESPDLEEMQSQGDDDTISLHSALFQQEESIEEEDAHNKQKNIMQLENFAQKEEDLPLPSTSLLLVSSSTSSPSSPSPNNSVSFELAGDFFFDLDDCDDLEDFDDFRHYRGFADFDHIEHIDFIFQDEPNLSNKEKILVTIGFGFLKIELYMDNHKILALLLPLAPHFTCFHFSSLEILSHIIKFSTCSSQTIVFDPG